MWLVGSGLFICRVGGLGGGVLRLGQRGGVEGPVLEGGAENLQRVPLLVACGADRCGRAAVSRVRWGRAAADKLGCGAVLE